MDITNDQWPIIQEPAYSSYRRFRAKINFRFKAYLHIYTDRNNLNDFSLLNLSLL